MSCPPWWPESGAPILAPHYRAKETERKYIPATAPVSPKTSVLPIILFPFLVLRYLDFTGVSSDGVSRARTGDAIKGGIECFKGLSAIACFQQLSLSSRQAVRNRCHVGKPLPASRLSSTDWRNILSPQDPSLLPIERSRSGEVRDLRRHPGMHRGRLAGVVDHVADPPVIP
jgi:hypothetical protein